MKKYYALFASICLIYVFSSCIDRQEPIAEDGQGQPLVVKRVNHVSSLSVSSSDIDRIVRRMRNKIEADEKRTNTNENIVSPTRGEYSLSTIWDDKGLPCIYVANFCDNQGFVLISATKDFDPVLAYAPTGSFPLSGTIAAPLEAWKKVTMTAINQAESLPDSAKTIYHKKWNMFMCNGDNPVSSFSNSSSSGNPRDDIWQSQVLDWMYAGYTVHMLTESSITGNAQIDELMREYAQDGVYYLYDWRTHAAVVESTPSDGYTFNLVQSVWNQSANYNDSCPLINGTLALVGCGPLAMGQIMRYHQYPSSFSWSDMPYTYSTSTTAQFLHQVGVACQAVYGVAATSVTIDNVKTALNYYGYHATKDGHNKSRVISNLLNGRPVLMTGIIQTANNGSGGHAWVASGCDNSSCHTRYELFVVESPTVISSIYVYETDFQYSDTYIYMNWGWGPNGGNGYYKDGYELNTAPDAHPVYPISGRNNIYDIYPNN